MPHPISRTARAHAAPRVKSTPPAGIAAGVPIMTLDGALPVEFLMPGDRVVTRTGVATLRGVAVKMLAGIRPVEISPSALGHGRPEQPVVMAPEQTVLLGGWRVRALYGADQALVPAQRLIDGCHVCALPVGALRVFELLFDTPQIVYAGALELGAGVVADKVEL